MSIANRLKAQFIRRLDELIAAGDAMPMQKHSERMSYNYVSGESRYRHYDLARWPAFVEWRTSCIAVLDQIVQPSSLLRKTVDALAVLIESWNRSASGDPAGPALYGTGYWPDAELVDPSGQYLGGSAGHRPDACGSVADSLQR
jgi:hypothetical protein